MSGQDQQGDFSDQQYYSDGNFAEDQYQEGMGSEVPTETADSAINGASLLEQGTKDPSDEDRKLFIGGVSWDTEQKDLKEYFSKFGEVTDVTIKSDPTTGKSRGFGFITFASEDSVDNVLKNVPHTIKGKQVEPKRAKVRPGVKKIFVGGLEADLSENDIKSHFEKYGKVENIELPFDKVKNQRRQFCFITFESETACENACKESKQKIGNKECDIKKATMKGDPRATRGGWGAGFSPRGRGRGAYNQAQSWGNQGYGSYGQGYGAYNQGYGGYGNYGYDYSGYTSGYGGGYGGYDYSGWNYGASGYGGGYEMGDEISTDGQQQSSYGKAARRGAVPIGYHPYTR